MAELVPCPTCGAQIARWERYPGMLCGACGEATCDDQGRRMRFSNAGTLGTGFQAEVEIGGRWQPVATPDEAATCWVLGRRCRASEHRFGGIVVQAID